jgi:hypothetical protein
VTTFYTYPEPTPDRPVRSPAGKVIFSDCYDRVIFKRKKLVDCCRIMMRDSIENARIILLNFLMTFFETICPVCDQYTIIRVNIGNPGCIMIVPIIVICGSHLFDLLPRILIDPLAECRGSETENSNCCKHPVMAHDVFLSLPVMLCCTQGFYHPHMQEPF